MTDRIITVMGHKVPDCDSTCTAIAIAHLLNEQGKQAEAFILGEPNPEAVYLLEQANIPMPETKLSVAGEDVYIVDYSDMALAPDDIRQANIIGIIDHHKLGDLTTNQPLECWIWPVGCSATILAHVYDFHQVMIPPKMAYLMLGAIISDTVNFRSPTTTDRDINTAERLAEISGVESINDLAQAQFAAKSDVSQVPDSKLILRDQKVFEMETVRFSISQIEVTNVNAVLARKAELLDALRHYHQDQSYDQCLVLISDINEMNSTVLSVGSLGDEVCSALLGERLDDQSFYLPGVVSRKKQIIPKLQNRFS
ncbi:manganese-dependent inorganic pyrophosphatase [Litoribacillus peritrichatus]|uniref:inorganic diphosphatase n=1 Tax=Litoribacillus peritrichatus TaxID=718191 RepID=A0ABP7N4M3_9GAMM